MPPARGPRARYVDPPHPASLPEEVLLRACTVSFGRQRGPGGQHRNKVETAAALVHEPTGIEAGAGERRSQAENRRVALRRLRLKLAREVRTAASPRRHQASELWERRRQGRMLPVNPRHADYPALLAEALDVIVARRWDVAKAAGLLGVSMSQLARLVRHDKAAFAMVNEGRTGRNLKPLR